MLENYTTEEQAADYPAGSYELALQTAVESGNQRDLDAVFRKRDGRETIRLGILLAVLLSGLVLFSRLLGPGPTDTQPHPLSVHEQQIAAAAGIIAAGDPWTVLGLFVRGKMLWP